MDTLSRTGWGLKDHYFELNDQSGVVVLKGNNYTLCNKPLPAFKQWATDFVHLDFSKKIEA
jgi:hypothetical protein